LAVNLFNLLFFTRKKYAGKSMEKCFHILIVDNDSSHLDFLDKALRQDFFLSKVKSDEECLALIEENTFDLLILNSDLQIPSSGFSTLQKIIEAYPYLPIIVISSSVNEEKAVIALKMGVRDYIRKARDQYYINKIKAAIGDIMKVMDETNNERGNNPFLHFFLANVDGFLTIWKKRILLLGNQIGFQEQPIIKKEELSCLYRAYLQDIEREKVEETIALFKRMIWEEKKDDKYILGVELLNISFKEAVREFLMKHPSYLKNYKKELMKRVRVIVDENNLSLSKEYEKILGQSLNRVRTDERLTTKYILLRTLQHEIRQPLSYIQNSAEILLTGECEEVQDRFIKNILEQAQKIERLLVKLEDDSQMLLTNYSDDLLMIDMSLEGE
jgi:CheY-like chemotaxis protein